MKCEIKLLDERQEPIKQRYQPRNPAMQKIIDEEAGKMQADGIIEDSKSAWSSPVVIAKKKTASPVSA